jgi:hypothetical protein
MKARRALGTPISCCRGRTGRRPWCFGPLAVSVALTACNGPTNLDFADASPPTNSARYDLPDCGPPDGPLGAYASAASGTIIGSSVDASICGASAFLYASPYAGAYLFWIDSSSAASFAQESPAQASDQILTGYMRVSAPTPGVYTSSDSQACGFLTFTYFLPIPAGVDCGYSTGPSCPPGCALPPTPIGSTAWCAPAQPEIDYGASAATDCLGDTETVAGSWTVRLTSVVAYAGDAGNENGLHFTTHGTITATLPDEEARVDSVTLTMGF